MIPFFIEDRTIYVLLYQVVNLFIEFLFCNS